VFLIVITLLNQRMTRVPINRSSGLSLQAERMSDTIKSEAEAVQALGMTGAAFQRWFRARSMALAEGLRAGDVGGRFGAISKTFRLFLQSAMLGVGAWLVLKNQLSPGAMIAASILMGRALQPIEQAIGQWAVVTRAKEGSKRLAELLTHVPPEPRRTELPRPRAILNVASLSVVPPGETQSVLQRVTFELGEGKALGVIGPSGAGKSTLARALIGIWRPASGKVRLDGAALDQYDPDVLGSYIGYLPQRVTLFEGTIAENIARLQPNPQSGKIVEAAQKAAAHDMILRLPEGYETRVSALGGRLSGGQIQRIGLARALYDNPVLLVLDEPNSNLDNDGTVALNVAIRNHKATGGSVLIMAHRPAAILECDLLLVLEDGLSRAFGPRDQILKDTVKNHTDIVRATGTGGVS
jgi:ATP-binding cassette subfamily C protein